MADNSMMPKGLVPHLVVDNAAKAMEFYKSAFGMEEQCRVPMPDGRVMHAEMRMVDHVVYLCDDFPEYCGGKARAPKALGGTPATIHQYVNDCDAAIERARKAGAKVVMEPQDMFWGDRYGMVEDPFGHAWSFATHLRDVSPEEMERAMKEMSGG